jgi:hypothetical protein
MHWAIVAGKELTDKGFSTRPDQNSGKSVPYYTLLNKLL